MGIKEGCLVEGDVFLGTYGTSNFLSSASLGYESMLTPTHQWAGLSSDTHTHTHTHSEEARKVCLHKCGPNYHRSSKKIYSNIYCAYNQRLSAYSLTQLAHTSAAICILWLVHNIHGFEQKIKAQTFLLIGETKNLLLHIPHDRNSHCLMYIYVYLEVSYV